MASINERLQQLEEEVIALRAKVIDLSANTEEKSKSPYSLGQKNSSPAIIRNGDIRSGKGASEGNGIIWYSSESDTPPANQEIDIPSNLDNVIAYNRHSHSRISGGALEINTLELVEFEFTTQNPHSPQFWQTQPKRVKVKNSNNEVKEKIGKLEVIFNADTEKWGAEAYQIDVEKCYLIKRDIDGNIELDENGNEMKAPMFNTDYTKTAVVWDKYAKCWRFFATYAPGNADGTTEV
jgi:hypothetical protein